MKGRVHSIETFATFEGKGIRTAVFMQGCNLRCAYCHNPDTRAANGGTEYTADEILAKILRCRPYFSRGGGVTFTGGEPLLQSVFLIELCGKLKEHGINTALDTSCSTFDKNAEELYKLIDTVIADLKFPTRKMYLDYCRADVFDKVIETLSYLDAIGKPVWLRTVVVPEVNDTEEFMASYAALIKGYKNIENYKLLPFHTMGFSKYTDLNLENPFADKEGMNKEKLDGLKLKLFDFQKQP